MDVKRLEQATVDRYDGKEEFSGVFCTFQLCHPR